MYKTKFATHIEKRRKRGTVDVPLSLFLDSLIMKAQEAGVKQYAEITIARKGLASGIFVVVEPHPTPLTGRLKNCSWRCSHSSNCMTNKPPFVIGTVRLDDAGNIMCLM